MMRNFLFHIMLLLCMFNVPSMGDEPQPSSELLDEITGKTLRPFFNALKDGNVKEIERYISGKKLQEAGLPKQEDNEYQELLREHYKGAVFHVEQAVSFDDQVLVDVKIEFPGRGSKLTQFYLQQQSQNTQGQATSSAKRWSITEQRHDRGKNR